MKRFLFWLVVSCCIVGFTASTIRIFFTRVVHTTLWFYDRPECRKRFGCIPTVHLIMPEIRSGSGLFLVDAATHRPSPYSRFVYVDLVNRRDSVLKKVKLALIDSVFAGYLKVPEDIRQGNIFCGVILTGCRIWGRLYL